MMHERTHGSPKHDTFIAVQVGFLEFFFKKPCSMSYLNSKFQKINIFRHILSTPTHPTKNMSSTSLSQIDYMLDSTHLCFMSANAWLNTQIVAIEIQILHWEMQRYPKQWYPKKNKCVLPPVSCTVYHSSEKVLFSTIWEYHFYFGTTPIATVQTVHFPLKRLPKCIHWNSLVD